MRRFGGFESPPEGECDDCDDEEGYSDDDGYEEGFGLFGGGDFVGEG